MAAYVFLGVNGHELQATEEDVVRTMLLLAERRITETELAAWLRSSSAPERKASRRRRKG
jgi:prophage maintenance system killer protein